MRLLLTAPPVHATTRCVRTVAISFISFFFFFFAACLFLVANFLGKPIEYEDAFVKLKPRLSYSSCDLTELHYILKKFRLIVFKLFTWTKHTQLFAFF